MEYTSNEKQILALMERTDFRNLSSLSSRDGHRIDGG